MTRSTGRPYLAIPGPSVLPDQVLQAMQRPSPDIYQGELVDMVPGLIADLKAIARTSHQLAIYISNGHGAWEAALSNVLAPGDRVLVLATGLFAQGWAEVARGVGAQVEILDFGRDSAIDPARLARALEADAAHRIKAVMAVHVDTSTSVRSDIAALRQAIDGVGHPALLLVDCIASLACDRFEMDAWGVDVMVAGSQKGLMTPAGLGFVFFNDRADRARGRCPTSSYWDWRSRAAPEAFYQYFGGTAPTHHLFALRQALAMIKDEGLENTWARHGLLARSYWAAVEAWGQTGPLRLNVADPAQRSHAVTTLLLEPPQARDLRAWLSAHTGVTLGIGLGMDSPDDPQADGVFRIGHMGHLNAQMVFGVIGAIEAAFQALSIPHGSGALEAAAKVIAQKVIAQPGRA